METMLATFLQAMEQTTTINPTITISWTVLAAMAGILSLVVGCATAYLKMFIGLKLTTLEDKLMAIIRAEFARKDVSDERIQSLSNRVARLESQVFPTHK